jgi:hypothetical protein
MSSVDLCTCVRAEWSDLLQALQVDVSKWEFCRSRPEGQIFRSPTLSRVISSVFWSDAKLLAIAMGGHSRLGASSGFARLDVALLKNIASKADLLGSLELVAVGNRKAIEKRLEDLGASDPEIETLMMNYLEERKRIKHYHYMEVLAGRHLCFFRPAVKADLAARTHLRKLHQAKGRDFVRWVEDRR